MLVLEHDQNVKGNIQIEATVMIFTSLSTVYFVVQAVFSLEILKCAWPFKINGGNTLHDIHPLHTYTHILHDNFFHIDVWNN